MTNYFVGVQASACSFLDTINRELQRTVWIFSPKEKLWKLCTIIAMCICFGSLYAADAGLSGTPAQPNFSPDSKYADNVRGYQGSPSIERATNGRLWAAWYGDGAIPGDNMHNFAMDAEDSCSADPAWSKPRRISEGVILNKPTVLANGDWLAPVRNWRDELSSKVLCSKDNGERWKTIGSPVIPAKEDRNRNESMIVGLKDGSLWMLVRTKYGIGESISKDGGKTWSDLKPSGIPHAESRFFIRCLKSGRILLVRHNAPDIIARSHLNAFLSDDEGHTWNKGLMIDERGVSYPDGVEGPDGEIRIIYDHMRTDNGQILMSVFSEKDVEKGEFSPSARQRILVNQATGDNPYNSKGK